MFAPICLNRKAGTAFYDWISSLLPVQRIKRCREWKKNNMYNRHKQWRWMWKKYSGSSSCLESLSWQIMKIELLRFSSDACILCSEGELSSLYKSPALTILFLCIPTAVSFVCIQRLSKEIFVLFILARLLIYLGTVAHQWAESKLGDVESRPGKL